MNDAFTRDDNDLPAIDLDEAAARAARPMSIADVLATAKLPEAHAELCLEPNLEAAYQSVLSELLPLVDQQGNVLVDEDAAIGEESPAARAEALAAELDRLKAQMQASTWRPRFRGMTSESLVVFQKEHYPKEQGASLVEYHDRLIAATMVEPPVTVDEVQALRRKLSAQGFAKLIGVAQKVCTTDIDAPKLPSFSRALKQH